MHVVVCLNHIPDPEVPTRLFRLDGRTNRPVFLGKVNSVIGPFDENALETALQLKDSVGARVTALTAGPASNQDAVRRALGFRCDSAVHVKEEQATELDSPGIAHLLGSAIRKLESVDLVLCGRQVGDWDGGQVGQLLAEELGFACVALALEIQPAGDGAIRATREVPGGVAATEATLPAVATITNTPRNQLRMARIRDTVAAFQKPLTVWTASDLGVDMADLVGTGARVLVRRLRIPESNTQVEMVQGESPDEIAEVLARRILAMHVV